MCSFGKWETGGEMGVKEFENNLFFLLSLLFPMTSKEIMI